jgi:hypothetical protein
MKPRVYRNRDGNWVCEAHSPHKYNAFLSWREAFDFARYLVVTYKLRMSA